MTFVAMQFNPPVKWMTEEEILATPMLGSFTSVRGNRVNKFVDLSDITDLWWYGEQYEDAPIKWHRVIVIRKPNDRPFDDSGKQNG